MFDIDRWLKRLWLANGVLLLILLVLGGGALLFETLSGAFGPKDAVLAPGANGTPAARPRAVRYSPPRPIWGTKNRVVIIRYGKAQERGEFSFASSERAYRDDDGPAVNLLFLTGTAPGRILLDKPAYVAWFDFPTSKQDSLVKWATYRIAFEDTNHDGRLDADDDVNLYVSDLDGSDLRRVLPQGMRLLDHQALDDGRHLIVTALELPKDWHGSDDQLPQRAFLYDVPTRTATPYPALDSLVQNASRILSRP
jgi:hypothetical protein